tara:strand:- start:435 stop:572 length:138 start_codon:yes stop_codon:yes gene_type:complete
MKDKIKEAHKFANRQLIKQWLLSQAKLSNGQMVLILLILAVALVL